MKTRKHITAIGAFLMAALGAQAQNTFTLITNSPVVSDVGMFTIASWADFNNDGALDLFVCNYGRSNVFYLNKGDGTFAKTSQSDWLQNPDAHNSAAAADFDNDGYLDLVVSSGVEASSPELNALYHQNGDGSFDIVSGGSVTNQLGFFDSCSWADYDNDGFVDLFVTDAGASTGGVLQGGRNLLFHNNGNGTFSKVTTESIVNDVGIGFGALWTDYDNDGFMDLLVVNLQVGSSASRNFLYHNNRNGTFTRITTNAVAADLWPYGTESAAWGDYDNDGLPDLFVGDLGGLRNRLYHNNGKGSFTNVTTGAILTPPSANGVANCAWGDYDNDGYLDLFVGSWAGPNALYHNEGNGTFTRVSSDPQLLNAGRSGIVINGVAWVDYDNDGSLDVFLTRFTLSGSGMEGPSSSLLFHNNGNTNGWLEVKLVGTVSNRSGIGAKVRAYATIGGRAFWQMREITSGNGWDMHPLVAHFGFGDATNIDTLRIEWPSGMVQELHDLMPRQILKVTEPARLQASISNGVPHFFLKAWPAMKFDILSSTDLASWSSLGTLVISNLDGFAEIIDTNAPASAQMFYRAAPHFPSP